jgi:hypothetical protein
VAVLVGLAAIPAYLVVAPAWRPLAVRLACAVIVIFGCTRVVGSVRRSIEDDPPSALDAPLPPRRRPVLDERFVRVRDDLVFSRRSRHYFDTFLWPRLRKLGAAEPAPPAERRRRGPSLRTLERLIADIERRP